MNIKSIGSILAIAAGLGLFGWMYLERSDRRAENRLNQRIETGVSDSIRRSMEQQQQRN